MDFLPLAFSLVDFLWDSWWEFKSYFGRPTKTQWILLSVAAVLFGFLCLRGNRLRI